MSNTPTITYIPENSTASAAWYDSITGVYSKSANTSAADSMEPVSIAFLVPAGYVASITATLGVDDWGTLRITNVQTGSEVLLLSLTSNDDEPGPNGGHTYWEKTETATLSSGTYAISVSHQNITYPADKDPQYNAATCNFSISATKTHLLHTVSTTYTLSLKSDGISMTCPVNIVADCHDNGAGGKIIENVRISSTGELEYVSLDTSGRVYKILIESLSVAFIGDTVNDPVASACARLVCVYWTGRIWDPLVDGDKYPDGRPISGNTNTSTTNENPTLFCSFP